MRHRFASSAVCGRLQAFLTLRRLRQRWISLLSCCLLGIWLCYGFSFASASYGQSAASDPSAEALVQQGLALYHRGDLPAAVERWQQSLSIQENEKLPQSTEVLKYLARAYQQLGQMSAAMAPLTELATHYRQIEDNRQLSYILVEQAQIYDELGQHQNAIALLCGQTTPLICDGDGALVLARRVSDPLGEAAALGVLGQTYYLQGEYEPAIATLESSLEIAQTIDHTGYQIAALNTLGNVYTNLSQRSFRYAWFAKQSQDMDTAANLEQTAQASDRQAIDAFTKSLKLAQRQGDTLSVVRSQLNLILPTYRQQPSATAKSDILLQLAQTQLQQLPDTREKAYSTIRLANLVSQTQAPPAPFQGFAQCGPIDNRTADLLQQAVAIARRIQDPIAESFALGWLGHLYECAEDYQSSQQLTERALLLAIAPESQYLWEWQLGRLFKANGESDKAIQAYGQAVKTLKQVEGDIAIANRDLRLDFRDAVEGIYRQLTELQLEQAIAADSPTVQQPLLRSALSTLDNVRLAELRNYLGSACDLSAVATFSQIPGPATAALSTLILDDQLAVILTLPTTEGQVKTSLHRIPLSKSELTDRVNQFRNHLEQRADRTNSFLPEAQTMYDWLVRPFAAELTASKIQTLAFNHDGILRSIPMAALHDGEKFLIETYGVVNNSSATSSYSPSQPSLQVLAFGLTTAAKIAPTKQFPALVGVEKEIDQIKTTVPNSLTFLDEAFTQQQLHSALKTKPASVLHIATHAQFGYDSNDTFLITGEKTSGYNQPLRMNELYRLIRQLPPDRPPLELLTLTACETAAGSERDALGLAGVALQAGVESAIASLWQVDDAAAAELISHFYQHLNQGKSRSAALQLAQKEWLTTQQGRYLHPGYWAVLVLIGS